MRTEGTGNATDSTYRVYADRTAEFRIIGILAAIDSAPEYFSANRNAAFFVTSYGPDQDFDQKRPSAALYEPSNGVVSNGDILAAVPGNRQEGYPYTTGNAIFSY